MATPTLVLVWLASFATLLSLGLFRSFDDAATRLVIGVLATVGWGFVGLASWSVIVASDPSIVEASVWPTIYLGLGLSMLHLLYVMREFAAIVGSETGATEIDGLER